MAPSVDGDTKVGATSYMEEGKALGFKIINLRLSELALRYPNYFKFCHTFNMPIFWLVAECISQLL